MRKSRNKRGRRGGEETGSREIKGGDVVDEEVAK